jgi:polyphosphate glucokinase
MLAAKKKLTANQPMTLAIDIGGTGLKASVLDSGGKMMVERVHVATPYPCTPDVLVDALVRLVAPLPPYDRVSAGFPGVVRRGEVVTAPHFGSERWHGFPLADTLAKLLGRKVRLLNDAEMQGLGVIRRRGLEVVLTLGTGIGSAVFTSGRLAPHLELAHHPIHGTKTYNDYLGNDAMHAQGSKKWNKRVRRMIEIVQALLNFDTLYIGGGNARQVTIELPPNVHLTANDAGITGGIHLWDDAVWSETT